MFLAQNQEKYFLTDNKAETAKKATHTTVIFLPPTKETTKLENRFPSIFRETASFYAPMGRYLLSIYQIINGSIASSPVVQEQLIGSKMCDTLFNLVNGNQQYYFEVTDVIKADTAIYLTLPELSYTMYQNKIVQFAKWHTVQHLYTNLRKKMNCYFRKPQSELSNAEYFKIIATALKGNINKQERYTFSVTTYKELGIEDQVITFPLQNTTEFYPVLKDLLENKISDVACLTLKPYSFPQEKNIVLPSIVIIPDSIEYRFVDNLTPANYFMKLFGITDLTYGMDAITLISVMANIELVGFKKILFHTFSRDMPSKSHCKAYVSYQKDGKTNVQYEGTIDSVLTSILEDLAKYQTVYVTLKNTTSGYLSFILDTSTLN